MNEGFGYIKRKMGINVAYISEIKTASLSDKLNFGRKEEVNN